MGFSKLELAACALVALMPAVAIASYTLPAYAQDGGAVIPEAPPITAEQFNMNPQNLLSGNVGANVTNVLSGNPQAATQVAQVLQGANPNLDLTQITNMTTNLANNIQTQGLAAASNAVSNVTGINPATAAGIVNAVVTGQMPPQVAQALSQIQNLGNLNNLQSLATGLATQQLQQALSGLSIPDAGRAIDQMLSALTGGLGVDALTAQGMQALTQAVSQIAPQVAQYLGAGLEQALAGSLEQIASTGGLGGAAMGGLGGAAGGMTGGVGDAAAGAGQQTGGGGSTALEGAYGCGAGCTIEIPKHHLLKLQPENTQLHVEIKNEISSEIQRNNNWFVTTFWLEHILPALTRMASQLTTMGILQVEMIGTFLDAKHQLETQRLFQQLTAKAHKDYHPSEGMCTFGTTVRSLAGSERRSNFAQTALAQRMMQRQALNGAVLSAESVDSDIRSRLKIYIDTYCDQADNANGLNSLCKTPVPKPERRNIDVDYTRAVESKLTLDLDFLPAANGTTNANPSEDEQDIFALSANLYAHNVAPKIMPEMLAAQDGRVRKSAAEKYMDLRAVLAKRSVAQNSFAAITAMRAAGSSESAPYTKALIKELGVTSEDEINKLLGNNPSYFAQMEVLTKKLYQNPVFYTELYDKPVNVERKGAALQAIGLMQDRDLYNSLLRSEAVLSVLLETMLQKEQEKAVNAMNNLNTAGGAR